MDERIEIGDKLITKELCDFAPILNRPTSCRQRRQVASYSDIREDFDLEKIPENVNSRRTRRSKPQHCPSCECQSVTDHSPISRLNDTPRHKNPEKLGSTLNQRVNYSTSKVASFPMRNSHVEQRHRQHRYSRPGARHSQDRNNLENPTISYRSRKVQKIEIPEFSTIDSNPDKFDRQNQNRNNLENVTISRRSRKDQIVQKPEIAKIDSNIGENFNSELETEQMDFRLGNEQNDFTQHRKDRQSRSDAIEQNLVGEIDRLPDQRCQDYSQSKQWHSSQRVSVRDDCRVDETETWMENRSTDTRDDWLYDRDQRELKDLHEAVRQLAKLRNSGWNKQDRKQTERREDSRETLERINRLVNKLPIARQKKGNRDAIVSSREENQSRKNKTIRQLRDRTSKSDEQKKPLASGQTRRMDGCIGPSSEDCDKVEKSLEDELFDIEVESWRRVEENEEAASETEEEARELASKEMKKCRFERESNKISWETKLSKKNRDVPRVTNEYKDEKEKIDLEKSSVQRKGICALENFKGKKDKKEVKENGEFKQLSATIRNYGDESDFELLTHEDEFTNAKNVHNWEKRGTSKNETDDKIQEESKRHSYRTRYSLKEPELERSKARNRIDDTIDGGLSRENEWRYSGTIRRQSFNAMDCHYDGDAEKQVLAERLNSNESNKTKEKNQISPARHDSKRFLPEAIRGDCCIESRKSRDYARELKNRRLEYLNHMRNNLGKLFELERCPELPSPGRHSSLPIVTTDMNAINDR